MFYLTCISGSEKGPIVIPVHPTTAAPVKVTSVKPTEKPVTQTDHSDHSDSSQSHGKSCKIL